MSGSLGYQGAAPSLEAALEPLWPAPGTGIAMSVAARPGLRRAVPPRRTVVECPVAWGTTIWDAAPQAVAVVESPNLLGRLEPVPPGSGEALLVQDAGSPYPGGRPSAVVLRDGADAYHVYAPGTSRSTPPNLGAEEADFRSRTKAARRLSKGLNQLPGVRLAHGDAESPAFVVLLPVAPGPVARAVSGLGSGIAAEALVGIPGLPAALLVTVVADGDPVGRDRWLDSVAGLTATSAAKGAM